MSREVGVNTEKYGIDVNKKKVSKGRSEKCLILLRIIKKKRKNKVKLTSLYGKL